MRKQLLGATAVLLGATTLGLGLPAAPTHADVWKTSAKVPFPAGTVTDVDLVSTGDGDAVAAAIIDGAVYSSTATNGAWSASVQVRGDVDATKLVLASNGQGDTAIGWLEQVGPGSRLRVGRQVGPTDWSPLHLVTPVGTDVVGAPQLGVAGDGLVIAAATVDGDNDNELFVTEWAAGGAPGTAKSLSASDSWNPSLDVNSKGEALIAFNYTGLIDDVMSVVRRTPGQGWNVGETTHNSGDVASAPDVAISENGKGQVFYTVVTNAGYWPESSPVSTDGTPLQAHLISTPEAATTAWEPNVDMNASGTALFTYRTQEGGVTELHYATAADGAYAANPHVLNSTLPNATAPVARIGDGGLRLIHSSGDGKVATHFRTNQVQPFTSLTSGPGHLADTAVDVDRGGNAVTIRIKPADGVYAQFFDAGGPTLALIQPGSAVTFSTSIPVAWSVSDALSSLQGGTDIYATTAAWNSPMHGAPAVVLDNAPGTSANFAAVPGSSYCFQAVAADTASNSTTTAKSCTTVPLDNTAFTARKWKQKSRAAHFLTTVAQTKKKGASLKLKGIQAKELTLIADRLPKGGKVRVKWNGTVVRTLKLKGAKATSQSFPLAAFASVQGGDLTIKVISKSGRKLIIDGLIVTK